MNEEFLYNETVTAQNLNDIAKDLGLALYTEFPKDPPQSAVSALNQITADLTAAGILSEGNCMKVYRGDTAVSVSSGVCVFENGAKARISDMESVGIIPGCANYIYLKNNTQSNRITLECSAEEPKTGDFVMLAVISEDGEVFDRRKFSRSKTYLGTGETAEGTFSETREDYFEDEKMCINGKAEGFDLTKYNFAVMYFKKPDGEMSRSNGCFGLFDLQKEAFTVRVKSTGSTDYSETDATPWKEREYNCPNRVKVIDGTLCHVTSAEYPVDVSEIAIRFV